MRATVAALVAPLVGVAAIALPARARAAEPGIAAIYWQPPGEPPLGEAARAGFTAAVRPLGVRLLDASTTAPPAPPSLAPALDEAKADYARFQFAQATARLDELQRRADASGGGDLDARQLSEIFLYRGLSRLETASAEAAWDDLVRAARLDPARILDPARFPPRAVAAYKRAASEVAQLPRAELVVEAPPGAQLRVDGAPASSSTVAVTFGQHYVAVRADGFEPWAGVVPVAGARERFTPPLHAYQPPDGDRLLALAGTPPPRQLLVGALERGGAGWRFVARDVTLPDGKTVSDAVALGGETPARVAVEALVRRLVAPPAPAPVAAPAPSQAPPARRRWWPWAVGGGGAAVVVAVAITLGVVLGSPAPSVGGSVPSR